MAKATRMGLFVDRFISFNETRYAGNAEMLALFTGLTEADVTFEALTGTGTGIRSLTVKSISRNFIGVNQTYLAADLHDVNGYDLTDPVVAADKDAVLALTVPGVYAYKDTDGITDKIMVLLAHDVALEDQQTAAKAAFDAAVRVTLQPADMTTTATTITVDGPTVYGVIDFALATEAVINIPDTDYGQLTFPEA